MRFSLGLTNQMKKSPLSHVQMQYLVPANWESNPTASFAPLLAHPWAGDEAKPAGCCHSPQCLFFLLRREHLAGRSDLDVLFNFNLSLINTLTGTRMNPLDFKYFRIFSSPENTG